MSRPRSERARTRREQPQFYEHRTEHALEGLGDALRGCMAVVNFILAEQTPDWPRYHLLDVASADFQHAQRRLRKARRSPHHRT